MQNYHHFVVFRLSDLDISDGKSKKSDEASDEITDAEDSDDFSSSERGSSSEEETSTLNENSEFD